MHSFTSIVTFALSLSTIVSAAPIVVGVAVGISSTQLLNSLSNTGTNNNLPVKPQSTLILPIIPIVPILPHKSLTSLPVLNPTPTHSGSTDLLGPFDETPSLVLDTLLSGSKGGLVPSVVTLLAGQPTPKVLGGLIHLGIRDEVVYTSAYEGGGPKYVS